MTLTPQNNLTPVSIPSKVHQPSRREAHSLPRPARRNAIHSVDKNTLLAEQTAPDRAIHRVPVLAACTRLLIRASARHENRNDRGPTYHSESHA